MPYTIHLSRRIFQCSKEPSNSSMLRPFSASALSLFRLFHVSKMVPSRTFFIRGKKETSHGARSGKWGESSMGFMPFPVEKLLNTRRSVGRRTNLMRRGKNFAVTCFTCKSADKIGRQKLHDTPEVHRSSMLLSEMVRRILAKATSVRLDEGRPEQVDFELTFRLV